MQDKPVDGPFKSITAPKIVQLHKSHFNQTPNLWEMYINHKHSQSSTITQLHCNDNKTEIIRLIVFTVSEIVLLPQVCTPSISPYASNSSQKRKKQKKGPRCRPDALPGISQSKLHSSSLNNEQNKTKSVIPSVQRSVNVQ